MLIRTSSLVLRTSRTFKVVAPSVRTVCQSLPPSSTSPESRSPFERPSRYHADATVSARRRADILQLPDIQAHHEQRPRSQTSENLGEVVVQSSGHDGSISNHQQGGLVAPFRRTGSRGGGLLIETARPMVQTLRTATATAPRSTARLSPHAVAVAPSSRTMTACVANAAK